MSTPRRVLTLIAVEDAPGVWSWSASSGRSLAAARHAYTDSTAAGPATSRAVSHLITAAAAHLPIPDHAAAAGTSALTDEDDTTTPPPS